MDLNLMDLYKGQPDAHTFKVGEYATIKSIAGFDTIEGLLEFTDKSFKVVRVDNTLSDEFQDVELEGLKFLVTNYDLALAEKKS